jgi:UDP-N-acetylmuramate--alanine ligase
MKVDLSGRPFHFIGVGGIGMSALAYILAKRGHRISGSDLRSSNITTRLESVGAKIFTSQEAGNLSDNSLQVVCSTAIREDNPEYLRAKELGCQIFHRSDLLAALIEDYYSIAVAGTHGKTTTSSLMAYVLFRAELDPTIIVGGEVDAWEGNARLGLGKYLVAEADESDGSLTQHHPKIGIITNIELDHTDHYESLDSVINTFKIFAQQCETVIGCVDCDILRKHLQPQITYSLDDTKKVDYTVTNVVFHDNGCTANVLERGNFLGKLVLNLVGRHNLSNALAVIAAARNIGLDFPIIAEAMATFGGAKRRFEVKGQARGITLVDDYAHHPTEIMATLSSARLRLGHDDNRRVIAIFQPHRYSRTQEFLSQFADSFADADVVIITDIYSAGEKNLTNITGEHLAQAISHYHDQVFYQPSLTELTRFLPGILKTGDLTLFLGAGNLNQIIPEVLNLIGL